jgi:hypothetical protein
MASRGDVQEQVFLTIAPGAAVPPVIPLAASVTDDCCFNLPLFGDISDTDEFKNDRTDFLKAYDGATTAVILKLEKNISGVWTEVVDLIDNTYGTFFALGFFTTGNLSYIGYFMDWRQVLIDPATTNVLGEGTYRIKTIETNVLLGTINNYSFDYCLKQFSTDRADGTVFFSTDNSSILGDVNDPTKKMPYPSRWKGGIRIPGLFWKDSGSYEKEEIEYNDRKRIRLKDDQTENYEFESDRFQYDIHKYLKDIVFMGDLLLVTDYNKNNPNSHIKTPIQRDGAYEPKYFKGSKHMKVIVEFKSDYDNLRKLNC